MIRIHPDAHVDAAAVLGRQVVVGPGAVIEADVVIGDDCVIEAGAVVRSGVIMGSGNRVHPYAVIGGDPQDLSFDAAVTTHVRIGDRNVFREHVTVHRATAAGGATVIGSDCLMMNFSHVAHDCQVGDGCVFANGVQLGGHVQVDDAVVFGGGSMVHQFCRIGALAMVAASTLIRKDVLPYSLVGGEPVRHYRSNLIGLRRAGMTPEVVTAVAARLKALRRSGNRVACDDGGCAELAYLDRWLASPSRRGIYGWK